MIQPRHRPGSGSGIRALLLAILLATACAPAQSPDAAVEERIQRIASGLLSYHVVPGEEPFTVEERLALHGVPGVSVAVINEGRLEWARGWGEVEAGSGVPVTPETLFQAASISKPVMAVGALRLVEEGALSLDGDVNESLRSWRVPENSFTRGEKVTLRRLLSHSAGLTVHGFPGYGADELVPSIVEVLDGAPPANTAPVRVDTIPGSLWRYSGGGSSVVQLLMSDVTGRSFPELMEELVLVPAGMERSTYEQPLPPSRRDEAATAHTGDGEPVPGRYHTYPEMAAAGLWTTPSDLAALALEVQRARAGEPGRILRPETVREMLTVQAGGYGLGFSVSEEEGRLWFSHGGSNRGFRAMLLAMAHEGKGVVVMTNGDGGSDLAGEILRSVAREYGWSSHEPVVREAVALDRETLEALTGSYQVEVPGRPGEITLEVFVDDDRLRARAPAVGWRLRSLRAASPDTLFVVEGPFDLAVERNEAGRVTALTLLGVGDPLRLERTK